MMTIKSAASAALFVSVVCGLLWILLKQQTLIQVSVNTQSCRLTQDHFELQWRHSVEKTQWTEFYHIQGQHLILAYTDLVSFGAGTPSHYPIIFQKNGLVRMKVNQQLPELSWFISERMQGAIVTVGHHWKLYQDFPNYSLVHIQVVQQPLWKIWQIGACP